MTGSKKTLFIFGLFVFSLVLNIHAQKKEKQYTAMKLKSFAVNSINEGDTYSAIDYFEQYMQKKENDDKSAYLLGELYFVARDYLSARKWFEKAYELKPEKHPKALYYLGRIHMTQKEYDDASKKFKKFRSEFDDKKEASDYRKLIKYHMESCDMAPRILDSALVVWISHMNESINKASVEFSPAYLNDSLMIYASLRSDTAVYTIENDSVFAPKRKFYTAKKGTSNWDFVGEWTEEAFQSNVDVGNGAFSPDRNRFYFTKCDKNWKNKSICNLYVSHKQDGQWQEPELLPEPINLKKYTATQPAVGNSSKRKEEVLYFVSDRPEGRGGLDIWYTVYNKKKKEWSEPKECGTKINTPGDEMTPYFDMSTRYLYFSSNGLHSIGELDVMRSLGEMRSWTPADNVGYPINSPYDDFYYVINENKEDGFFVSNRPGGVNLMHETCCDDLYSFKYNEVVKVLVTGKTYAIYDDNIKELFKESFDLSEESFSQKNDTAKYDYVAGANVSLFLIDKENKELIFINADSTDSNGDYSFALEANKEYAIQFENYGYFNKTIKVTTDGIIKSDTIVMQPIGINLVPKVPMVVKNIYYEFDKSDLTRAAKKTIDTTLLSVLKEAPQIVVEISSHTDNKGGAEYNRKLSQKRAESVVNYLIKKGIDQKRLYAKGYGESKPIAPNENPDGSDNPDGRQKNRRTEFTIIGSLDQYSEIIYEE